VVEVRVEGSFDAVAVSPPTRARLVGLLVRPTAPPLAVGIAVATSYIVAETLLVYLLEKIAPGMTFGVLFLLGVLVVSAGRGLGLAVTTTLASAVVYAFVHLGADGSIFPIARQDWVTIIIFLPIALLANVLAGQARLRAAEANRRHQEAEAAGMSSVCSLANRPRCAALPHREDLDGRDISGAPDVV
jgi:K+-sensing histidine kinase KdpD